MITVNLKNGQVLNFPDGTPQDVMKSAISKNFPDQIDTPMGDIEKAVSNDVQKINQGQQPSSIANSKPKGPLGYEESPEEIGRYEGGKEYLKSGVPELFVSMLAPELKIAQGLSKIPSAYKMLQQSPRAAKVLQTLLGNAIPQAGVSAAFNPEDPTATAARTGAVTSAIDSASNFLFSNNKYANKLKSFLPAALRTKTGLQRQIGEQIGQEVTPQSLRNVDLAKEYGINLRPDEAIDNVKISGMANNLGKSPEGARSLQMYQEGQDVAHRGAVDRLNREIYNPGEMNPKLEKAYEEVSRGKLSPEAVEQVYTKKEKGLPASTGNVQEDLKNIMEHFSSPTKKLIAKDQNVKAAMKKVGSDPIWQEALKDVPKKGKKTTGAFLDAVKKEMDDKIQSLYNRGSNNKADLLTKSKNEFLNVLDEELPSYEYARSLYERKKTRETIENLTKSGQPHAESLSNYLKDADKKKDLVEHLRNVKGGEKIVDDLQDIFSKTKRIDIDKLAKKIAPNEYKAAPYNIRRLASSMLTALKGGKYDKAAVDLMTSKDWPDKVRELQKITNNEEYMSKLFHYMNKAVPKRIEGEKEPELEIVHRYNEFVPKYEQGAQ